MNKRHRGMKMDRVNEIARDEYYYTANISTYGIHSHRYSDTIGARIQATAQQSTAFKHIHEHEPKLRRTSRAIYLQRQQMCVCVCVYSDRINTQ